MFTILDKAKPDTGNTKGLNLAVVMFMTVQASRLPLWHQLLVSSMYIYMVSQEKCARLREGVPYSKVYRYNPKHLCPKLNGYGDNGQRKVWSSSRSMHCSYQLTCLINVCPWVWYGVTSLLASDVSCIVLGNPKDKYDTTASFFVAQFNGFMSLTS
jgi:hypothetical protein